MSRKLIRTLSLLLVAVCLLSTVSFAAPRASDQISICSGSVSANGSGSITISFSITGTDVMNTIGAKSITIYKYGGTYVTKLSYGNYTTMMGYSKMLHSGSVTYQGTSGQYYYAVITFYAKDSNGGSSTVSYTTNTVKA